MPSRKPSLFRQLVHKELSDLAHSPAFVILLICVGFLVGHEYITAVATYSEMSGAIGRVGSAALGMNPLDGILVPTFGAYDIAATLLLPFVVIRLFAADRASGAWTILLQSPSSVRAMVAAKSLALAIGWIIALIPGLLAVIFWLAAGGHVNGGELAVLLVGHLLRAGLTVAVAAVAASITQQAASAAIITLAATVGSWALDFIAATRGGVWARIAAFTPSASLRTFEQGLLRPGTVAVMFAFSFGGLAIASVWLDPTLTVFFECEAVV